MDNRIKRLVGNFPISFFSQTTGHTNHESNEIAFRQPLDNHFFIWDKIIKVGGKMEQGSFAKGCLWGILLSAILWGVIIFLVKSFIAWA